MFVITKGGLASQQLRGRWNPWPYSRSETATKLISGLIFGIEDISFNLQIPKLFRIALLPSGFVAAQWDYSTMSW